MNSLNSTSQKKMITYFRTNKQVVPRIVKIWPKPMACRTIFSRHFSTDFFFLSVFLFLIMLHSFFHSYDLFKQILIFLCLFSLLVCRFLYVYSFSNLPQPVPSDFTYTFSLFPFFFHCLLNSHQLYSFHPLPFLPTTSCVSALPPSFFYFHNGPSRFVIYFAAHLSSSSIFDFCFSLSSEIRHVFFFFLRFYFKLFSRLSLFKVFFLFSYFKSFLISSHDFFLIFTTLCFKMRNASVSSMPDLRTSRLFYSSLFSFCVRHNHWQTTKSNPIIQLLSSYQTNHPLISVVFLICFPKA